jgi:hypothetical protein
MPYAVRCSVWWSSLLGTGDAMWLLALGRAGDSAVFVLLASVPSFSSGGAPRLDGLTSMTPPLRPSLVSPDPNPSILVGTAPHRQPEYLTSILAPSSPPLLTRRSVSPLVPGTVVGHLPDLLRTAPDAIDSDTNFARKNKALVDQAAPVAALSLLCDRAPSRDSVPLDQDKF